MKVNLSKLFDIAALSDKIKAEVLPLVAFINTTSDQLIRTLQNGLTIRDNFNAEVKTLTYRYDVGNEHVVDFSPAKTAIEGISILQTVASDGSNTVNSFSWTRNNAGQVRVTIYPRTALAQGDTLQVKFLVMFS